MSGASFLYFRDDKLAFTLHPSVSTYLTGVDSFTYLEYLERESPPWKPEFLKFFNLYYAHKQALRATSDIIEPLRHDAFSTILLSYDRGMYAWQNSEEILASSSLSNDQIVDLIDPFHAADELYAHIFFEKVLEVQHPGEGDEFFVSLGKNATRSAGQGIQLRKDFNWKEIHDYCNILFTRYTLSQLLVRAYMFRMPLLRQMPELFLSNERLPAFLASLPVAPAALKDYANDDTLDVIAWEFFRQLVSRLIDPLDAGKVQTVKNLISKRQEEITRLKNKCHELAGDISSEKDMSRMPARVATHIKAKVENNLYDLFQIDKRSFQAFIGELFSDDKTWVATAAFIASLLYGGEVITAGSAIVALSSLGSKAFKQAAEKNVKLQSSTYALLYRMKSK